MADNKVGRAEVFLSSGWPVDKRSAERVYEGVEQTPIFEEYDAPVYRHRRAEVAFDGSVHRSEWLEYERRERQIGVTEQRYKQTVTDTSYRLRYDNGRLTGRFKLPSRTLASTRFHHVTIRHPLLRGDSTYWMTGDGAEYGRGGIWRRLVTARAAKAVRAYVAADRKKIMAAIAGFRFPTQVSSQVWGGWHVNEGVWDASMGRLRTAYGLVRLPGAKRHLQNGEMVIYTVDTDKGRHFAEQWISPSTDGVVRSAFAAPGRYLREWSTDIALLGAGLGIGYHGLTTGATGVTMLGAALGALGLYFASREDTGATERMTRRSRVLGEATRIMKAHLWARARAAHEHTSGAAK
ncbi:hypothetical protein [Sphingomonas sp. 3-13AW]|uniref:hypothetical protein n=1 Tax=Sphingomonas sp. 3-13AW TaxID=3050450 RepID=UPI003BB52FB6